MTNFHTPEPRAGQTVNTPIPPHEPGPQPDPMLDESGRRSGGWIWAVGAVMFLIVVVTLYGINNQEPQTAANESSAPAAQSETTGAAPQGQQEQQPAQQNGNADAQKSSGGSKQASPANSPNAAAPQKDQSGQTNQKPQQ